MLLCSSVSICNWKVLAFSSSSMQREINEAHFFFLQDIYICKESGKTIMKLDYQFPPLIIMASNIFHMNLSNIVTWITSTASQNAWNLIILLLSKSVGCPWQLLLQIRHPVDYSPILHIHRNMLSCFIQIMDSELGLN